MGYIYDNVKNDMEFDEFMFITNNFKEALTSCNSMIKKYEDLQKVAEPIILAFSFLVNFTLARKYPTVEKTENGQTLITWHQTIYSREIRSRFDGVECIYGLEEFKEMVGNKWRNPMNYYAPDDFSVIEFRI